MTENHNNATIQETYQQINQQIEIGGQNLQQIFAKREDELLKLYKNEMLKIQRQLKLLSEESSEIEIRKKIQSHREELEKEREEYLKRSIQLSDQLKELSQMEKEIKGNVEELIAEIRFLDEQLIYADKHFTILQEELESLSEDQIRFSQPPTKTNRFQQRSLQNLQLPKLDRKEILRQQIREEQQLNYQLRAQINIPDEPKEMEKCFDEAISSLPDSDASTLDLTCCNQFTEYQKRKIFEEFLEKPQIKKKIYQLLTRKG